MAFIRCVASELIADTNRSAFIFMIFVSSAILLFRDTLEISEYAFYLPQNFNILYDNRTHR